MASQEVLTALETLHREIEKLQPAIKHVEAAQQVTQTVKSIPEKHVELLREVKGSDTRHKEELKIIFAKEISSLAEETRKIQQSTGAIQKTIQLQQKEIDKLIQSILASYEKINDSDIPEKLTDISEFVTANNGFLDELHKGFPDGIEKILKQMEKMHTANVRSLQKIEENQNEQLVKLKAEIEGSKNLIKAIIGNLITIQNTNAYITWALVAAGIIITFILK